MAFVIVFFFMLLGTSPASYAEPKLRVELSGQRLAVGETLLLKILIEWPKPEAQYTFAFPQIPAQNLALVRQGESQESFERAGEAWTRKIFEIEFRPEAPGEALIPAFSIPYIDPNLQKGGTFSVEDQRILVTKSRKASGLPQWAAAGAVGLVLALLATVIFWARPKEVSKKPEPAGSWQEKSIQAFKELRALAGKDPKAWAFAMDGQFRRFLADCHHIPLAGERAMKEALQSKDLLPRELAELNKLFSMLQEAKFTGMVLSEKEAETLYEALIRYMEGKQIAGQPNLQEEFKR